MTFNEFNKKLGSGVSPDAAYKLYMNAKISIIEEIIKATVFNAEKWNSVEEKVLNSIIDSYKKS